MNFFKKVFRAQPAPKPQRRKRKATRPKAISTPALAKRYSVTPSLIRGRMQRHGVTEVMRRRSVPGRRPSVYWNAEEAHAAMAQRKRPGRKTPAPTKAPEASTNNDTRKKCMDPMINAISRYELARSRYDRLIAYSKMREAMLEIGRALGAEVFGGRKE